MKIFELWKFIDLWNEAGYAFLISLALFVCAWLKRCRDPVACLLLAVLACICAALPFIVRCYTSFFLMSGYAVEVSFISVWVSFLVHGMLVVFSLMILAPSCIRNWKISLFAYRRLIIALILCIVVDSCVVLLMTTLVHLYMY